MMTCSYTKNDVRTFDSISVKVVIYSGGLKLKAFCPQILTDIDKKVGGCWWLWGKLWPCKH